MATQYGFECWCADEVDLDYDRHHDSDSEGALCDMLCKGDTVSSQLAWPSFLVLPYRGGAPCCSKI